MFNVKWAVFPAGGAFLLALVSSLLIGQVGFGLALLRALVFGAAFFGIGCGAWVLINTYIPELLIFESRGEADDGIFQAELPAGASQDLLPGSNVNITLGDAEETAAPAALPRDSYGIDGVGNIADLVSREIEPAEKPLDIDQAQANDYNTELGDFSFASSTSDGDSGKLSAAAESAGLGDFSSFFDGLTAQDSMGGDMDDAFTDLFKPISRGQEEASMIERKTREVKPMEMKGDFSPKEIAAGLRTVLAKEKKG